jgi:Uma2 family endonuclease
MSSSALAEKLYYTEAEYLSMERSAPYKSEFFNGEIFAMSGASRVHNLITINLGREISRQIKNRRCEVYAGDMRVKVSASGLYTYPDIVGVCGAPQFEDDCLDTLLNPAMIIEVLSPSTESYDRGDKFAHYRRIASVQEYVMISQERFRVEYYIRHNDIWMFSEFSRSDDELVLTSLDCRIPLQEIYDKTDVEPDGI